MMNDFPDFSAAKEKIRDRTNSPPAPMRIINPVDLFQVDVPPREWIVDGWLPVGCVTANYGDGGVGKTLLSQQLMTSTCTNALWCGHAVMQCRSFGVFCEDDEAELHRRQDQICDHLGVHLNALGDMRWISGVGADNALATFDRDGWMNITDRFAAIKNAIMTFGARLVVLDTAADLFAGNENDRYQVRRFIGELNKLAIDINGAVLLNAHPSRDRTEHRQSGWRQTRDGATACDPGGHWRVLRRRMENRNRIPLTGF